MNNIGPCASDTQSNRGVWTIGGAIPTSSFLEAANASVGSGAVQVRYATMRGVPILQTSSSAQLGGNAPPRTDAFVDAASGMVCDPTPASDGKLRCIPRSIGGNILFTDAACTSPVFAWGSTCAAAPSVVVYPTAPFDVCGPVLSAARDVVGTTTVTSAYFLSSGTCTPAGLSPTDTFYALGPELPPGAFAEVTERTD